MRYAIAEGVLTRRKGMCLLRFELLSSPQTEGAKRGTIDATPLFPRHAAAWAAENAKWRIVLTSPRKQMRRAYAADQLFLVGLHRRVRRATP